MKEQTAKKQRSLWQDAWRRFKKNRTAMIGLAFFLFLIAIAITTLVIDLATGNEFYRNNVINQDLFGRLKGPSMAHPFGQDEFGRDMLLRMIWAVRYSLFMGSAAVIIGMVCGGVLGAMSGYYGKTVDAVIMRAMDILLAIPSMLLATAIVAALGTSLFNVLLAIAISYIPSFARTVRAAVLTVKDQEFIEAARAIGCHDGEIIFKYIIPNAMAPIIVQATMGLAGAILSIAGLSFLGLGVNAPMPSLGSLASDALNGISSYPYRLVIPAVIISLIVLSLNLLGDGLRDAFDPKLNA